MEQSKYISRRYIKNPLVTGTLLLTLAGLITKVIGFFYRIFLSRIFKEEGLGIIGLVSPVMVLVHSVTVSGLQNAITRYVAASKNKKEAAYGYLFTGLILSFTLSAVLTFFIFTKAEYIAVHYLHEARCAPLLKIVALSFPLSALHSCANGFFYGYKKAAVPSLSMLVEQLSRVLTVYLLYRLALQRNTSLSLSASCIGLALGECTSALFSYAALILHSRRQQNNSGFLHLFSYAKCAELFKLAFPLSLNRICISLLGTVETIALPKKLMESGLSRSAALSVYGVFTGMAFPLILFPSALTGSASALLLPTISEAQAAGKYSRIQKMTFLTILSCFLLGLAGMFFFLTFADFLGMFLFHSPQAVSQIKALAFVCPFLYLSGMLNSILHGLGKSTASFLFSLISIGIRLVFVFFIIPVIGFSGYLYGILCSQICLDLLIILALRHYIIYN